MASCFTHQDAPKHVCVPRLSYSTVRCDDTKCRACELCQQSIAAPRSWFLSVDGAVGARLVAEMAFLEWEVSREGRATRAMRERGILSWTPKTRSRYTKVGQQYSGTVVVIFIVHNEAYDDTCYVYKTWSLPRRDVGDLCVY